MAGRETLGQLVREARLRKQFSLRKFAEMVGVSATYISMIERDELSSTRKGGSLPIAEERLQQIAKLLDLDQDELLALAKKLPADVEAIIKKRPEKMAMLLRQAGRLSSSELDKLNKQLGGIRSDRNHQRND